jgi:two-component system OmpR family sensor kinase
MRQFLADASHELRTPLTVLRGTAQILLRHGDTQTPELKEALVAMHEETVRLSRLVDDLLTLSRLDAGQQLEPRPVALGDFLTRFIDRYAPAWPDRALEIDPAVDGTTAYVDPDALTRILTNLVDNAARYSAPGHPIELGASAVPAGVEIRVSDEGPGLKKEDAERVFERFYRASKSRARQSGGTGLGLSIVHALVQESGGEVRIETGPDRGTTVAVSLPRQQTEETRQRYTPL